jgi:signal transduction histidine kinase
MRPRPLLALKHAATRLRLPPRSARLRLTVLYGALFLVAGVGLLATAYGLVAVPGPVRAKTGLSRAEAGQAPPVPPGAAPEQTTKDRNDGRAVVPPALADAQHNADLRQLLTVFAFALMIMSVISTGLGWLMAGKVLQPLRTMTTRARQISEHNLHERLAVAGPDDELKELGDTFDGLLGRLEGAFDAQRRFVANASHELRTPLTLERAMIEVSLADPEASAESLRQTCERVLAVGAQQERLIAALLTLARSQRGPETREPLDLATITADVLEASTPNGLSIRSELKPAHTSGDPRLVERLVANLLDNAIRHNLPHGWIDVSTDTRAETPTLRIANSGPTIAPDHVSQLLEPFRREPADRTNSDPEGLGLGLSIVAAIADTHKADLRIHARAEGGLDIEVDFAQPRNAVPAPAPDARN